MLPLVSHNDPSTTGMAATYVSNSDFQRDSAASALPDIRQEVAAVLRRNSDRGFTLVDFGTGPGTSGLALFGAVIAAVRAADPAREVTVVHQDLPGNAWGDLFDRLERDPDSYLALADPPPALAAVGSFYRRCMPPESVHFGMSFMSAHWMSIQEHPSVPSSAAVVDADPADRVRIAADAARDWEHFWSCRGDELAVGGAVVVKCIGSLPDRSESTSRGILEMLGEALQAAADSGLITQQAADGYVLSEYPRTVAEAREPFESGSLPQLQLDVADVDQERDPYRARYGEDGDASEYARRLSGFLRAFTESSVRAHLTRCGGAAVDGGTLPVSAEVASTAGRGTAPEATASTGSESHSLDDVVNWIYRWCQHRWQSDPDVHPFEAWTLTVSAHKV